ncbi:4-alpha-glucanotransferase [Spirochaetes bacterium]|uniref:4-alpha-glucanotransferase n=1 Tax=Candidatus Scatousia excrementipullorum TaxID=2840936 RepID=A0A9D9DTY7_9BACT|nr:4-alpha-glucanotransferase [Candidatus Scatousia excrementipullorum]
MKVNAINILNHVFTAKRVSHNENRQNNICMPQTSYDCFQKNNIYNAITFTGVDGRGKVKQRGMMFHISNLPATRSYCGQFLDPETDKFIDFLEKSRQTHWIMNPLFALGEDLCPYNASGRFSKNIYLVNLNELTKDKYGNILKPSELPDDITAPVFTLDMLKTQKLPRFEKAFERFQKLEPAHPLKAEYTEFVRENKDLWLDTYAAYDGISKLYGDNWKNWPKDLQVLPQTATEEEKSLETVLTETLEGRLSEKQIQKVVKDINLFKFEQFLYDKQFNEFNNQLKNKGINLILDLAIGVSPNGVDVWANKDMFLLDENFNPVKVSGCPPEAAYPRTQVWGHALYNYDSPKFWDYQEASIKKLIKEGDLRLDHFVGYINRAEIPAEYRTNEGRILRGEQIFAPVEEGGMGKDFFLSDWIVRIDEKRNARNENMFELFIRVAREEGKKPEDCYILEDFGPLAETEAYKEFKEKFGTDFISQRIPVAMGIGEHITSPQDQNNISSPEKIKNEKNIAILTGNHDLPPLRDYVDLLLDNEPQEVNGKNSPALFREFCKNELHLTDDEIKDRDLVMKELMKWHYTQDNVKQVQTTLPDALGIYFRPNIPGYSNGMKDKYLMKTTPEALLPYWSRVFPKGFLDRTDKNGINPGYKDLADDYIKMMDNLYKSF